MLQQARCSAHGQQYSGLALTGSGTGNCFSHNIQEDAAQAPPLHDVADTRVAHLLSCVAVLQLCSA
jgi:hypothetical protein